jgi:dTMP kinase
MARGKFIVIEGGDGAGKDTQIEFLKRRFPAPDFAYARDPGGTELGTKLREITQHGENVAREAELFLLLASRAQLVHEVIMPALAAGIHVVSNRFDISTFAYQIYGRERLSEKAFLKQLSDYARGEAVPDLVVLLDTPPEVGLARLPDRGEEATRFEREAIAFHERVREGYREAANEYPNVRIIDAARSKEDVWKDVEKAVQSVLN